MTAEGAEDSAKAVTLYFNSISVVVIIKYIYSLVPYSSDFMYIAQNHNHIASVDFTISTVSDIIVDVLLCWEWIGEREREREKPLKGAKKKMEETSGGAT